MKCENRLFLLYSLLGFKYRKKKKEKEKQYTTFYKIGFKTKACACLFTILNLLIIIAIQLYI